MRTREYMYAEWELEGAVEGSEPRRQLFDLGEDPWQLQNVARREEYADTVTEMSALLRAGWQGARDGLPR